MTQEANPAKPGSWKQARPRFYSHWAVMYEDSRSHVDWWPVGKFGPNPWEHLRFRLRTLYDQLTPDEHKAYATAVQLGVNLQPEVWEQAQQAFALAAGGATRDELQTDHGILIDPGDHQIAVAAHTAGLTI